MQPMLPASDSNSQTTMPAPRLGPIPLMVTHLMSPHLTQEMRDNLASDAFLALPAPAQSATIVAYAQAIETAAAAAQERESIKNKDFINNSAHQQVTLQNTVVRLEGDVERLGAERLKMLESAVAAETERDLLKAHVRKIYDSRASNRAGPTSGPRGRNALRTRVDAVVARRGAGGRGCLTEVPGVGAAGRRGVAYLRPVAGESTAWLSRSVGAHAGGAPCRVVHEPPPLNARTMSAP